MDTLISSCWPQEVIQIAHATDVAAARRAGQRLAQQLGFDETRAGKLAIVISEAATNILKHAGEGQLYIMPAQTPAAVGIDVVAVDNGPGMDSVAASAIDGVSTVGTAGTGLGALRRLTGQFEAYSARGKGTLLFMRVWRDAAPAPDAIEVGALTVPLAGEDACGDGWAVDWRDDGATLLAADGLGHGPEAARAAQAAIAVLQQQRNLPPEALLDEAHQALRITRGAALAFVHLDCVNDLLTFTGIGNISASVFADGGKRNLLSHNGIVGHNMRKTQPFTLPFPPGALCVLHSDGVQTQWDLAAYPGILACHPALVAAVLLRDWPRRRDDAMVLAVRRAEGPWTNAS